MSDKCYGGHSRRDEYNYEREIYVDDQSCLNCRYFCFWDPEKTKRGCKNYSREDYERKPESNWCMDWKGKRGYR